MQRYANNGGDSGVTNFEIGAGSIVVEFRDGAAYLYDNAHTGAANIAEMQGLATAGSGLNSFISRVVRKNYARKLR
jgi:hypothetical protein